MSFVDHDPRQIAPDRFFMVMDVTSALFALWLVLVVTGSMPDQQRLLSLAWGLGLSVMFFRRGQDEFWDHCWRTATSAAFLGLVVVPILWGFFGGVIDGWQDAAAADRANAPVPAAGEGANTTPTLNAIMAVLFAIFFVRFQWARFRGDMG